MFVIEQIGHICIGGPYWSVLKASSVGCDPLVLLNEEIVGIWIVRTPSPFKLTTVCGQEHPRAVFREKVR